MLVIILFMEITENDKDRFVVCSLQPQWGRGKIRAVKEGRAYLLFEGDPERIERKFSLYSDVLQLADNQDASTFKVKAKGVASKGVTHRAPKVPVRYELASLVDIFKTRYPGGFDDPIYREDLKKGERAYKEGAIAYFREHFLSDGKMKKAVEEKNTAYLKEHIAVIVNLKLNLIHITEKFSLLAGLKIQDFSLELFHALISVLEDPEIRHETMGHYLEVFNHVPVKDFNKWTIATLFTYLAQPERHMFLKPEATNRFASAVGWELNYEPHPN